MGRRNQRRAEIKKINKLKAIASKGGKCSRCGFNDLEHLCVFDFHHIEAREGNVHPGGMMEYSWDKIEAELNKCILLCANCHRIIHEED